MKSKNTLIIIIIVILLIIAGFIWGKNFFHKQGNLENVGQKINDEIFIDILAHGFVWKSELIEEGQYSSEEGENILSSKISSLLIKHDLTEEDILVYENMLNEKFENDPEYYEDVSRKFEERVTELKTEKK